MSASSPKWLVKNWINYSDVTICVYTNELSLKKKSILSTTKKVPMKFSGILFSYYQTGNASLRTDLI